MQPWIGRLRWAARSTHAALQGRHPNVATVCAGAAAGNRSHLKLPVASPALSSSTQCCQIITADRTAEGARKLAEEAQAAQKALEAQLAEQQAAAAALQVRGQGGWAGHVILQLVARKLPACE